ncbi:RHS repeat domain-containing protein [Streptomyces sp. NBC_00576]|uniref:RHS repeat domain-containing protein n=1 Tax=Streptomyces sp. NBC_00576 TaxID=2903665 RepID=UPI002E814F20|nr:RHS repeat-associated core domain-containing protein [Streptomyces sp. NBC_00576]WUB74199.1 RHS repeat-associated core domain-containing protein [Streptomyces sp. NBC_00576]
MLSALVMTLVVSTVVAAPVQAADSVGGLGKPKLPEQLVTEVHEFSGQSAKKARARVAETRAENAEQGRRARAEQTATWPKAGSAKAGLAGKGKAARLTAGGLPVTLTGTRDGASGDARVEVRSRKATEAAGIKGVLLTATATAPGTAEVSVDYSDFASAYGGGWSGRLRLFQLPACALTTPNKAACRERTPLDSDNNISGQTVSAKVSLAAEPGAPTAQKSSSTPNSTAKSATSASSASSAVTVLALAATAGASTSGAGDYTASPLSPASSWEAGGSSGAFTWSYDMAVPPAAAGPSPSLSLSYDSGSVDGRTASTNNQSNPVGEGFEISSSSYIERSYGSCDKDGQTDKFDLCWKFENASIVLNGKSSKLVKVDAADKTDDVWRLSSDDSSTVVRSTGGDNGDDDGEYWTVTTGDGTKYVFGQHKLPGAATTDRTNSVWTVPVYGNDSGEPGYDKGSAFAGRSLTQAWRWNLDYVVDLRGNAMTYWYTPETNYYAQNDAATATAKYTRGGYLTEIRYGQNKDTLFSGVTSDKVTFSYTERCTVSDCGELTDSSAPKWPDVPFDSICASGADCDASSPSFFTRKRLTGVNTHAWSAATSAFTAVDSWALDQDFKDGNDLGDTSDHSLVLESVQHTGKNGTAIKLDPVTFTYEMRPNRVDSDQDNILPLNRPRIRTVTSETGAVTTVTISGPECVRGSNMPAAEDDNSKPCYPQYWNINGADQASIDWFHKYRVTAVTSADPYSQSADIENAYTYADPAWHYNDDPLTPEAERTWSVWRGYGKVTSTKGIAGATQSKTVSTYLQGMHGDKLKGTATTRSASVAGIDFTGLDVADQTDSDPYAGFLRERITYNGSTPVSVTVNDPWYRTTATHSASNTKAYYVRTARAFTHTYLTAKASWRTRTTATTEWDAYGQPLKVYDEGDAAVTGDETCTRTWYAANDALGINSLVTRTRVLGRACTPAETDLALPTSSATRGDVLSDTAMVYDGTSTTAAWSASQTLTKGEVTWVGRPTAYPAAATNGERHPSAWQTTSRTTYDTLGRVATVTDTDGNTMATFYVPEAVGPLTRTKVTNAKTQSTFVYADYARGLPTKVYDINNKITETTYDALGRQTATWLPNRSSASDYSPNYTYAYSVTNSDNSWSSTSTLKADGTTYNTSYAIYDSLLRPLQSQSPTPQGGRLLTDTRYNDRGLAYQTYADAFDSESLPSGEYSAVAYGRSPKQSVTVFDGAERPVTSTFYVVGVEKWSTSSTYTGDSTATTAPGGGSAARTIVDAQGRTKETREYEGASPADTGFGATVGATYTSTKFTYTRDGKQSTIAGPDSSWSYLYDLFGRQTSATDPDMGTTTTGYTALDQVSWTKDAAARIVISAYDVLGRTTGTWSAPATADLSSTAEEKVDANKLTAYTYDGVANAKGQRDSATRYVGGAVTTGSAYTKRVTAFDSLYRATATKLELPESDPLVAKKAVADRTLTFTADYRIDGTLQSSTEPAAGGLASEQVIYKYDGLGLNTQTEGTSAYLLDASYTSLSQPQVLSLGKSEAEGTYNTYINNQYETGTDRLLRSSVTDDTHAYALQQLNYAYDAAGNVTSISDPMTLGGTGVADNQCFAYDGHRRLTDAWTPAAADCSTANRTTAKLGGAAPYWTSYTYKDSGLRATEVTKTSSTPTTRTYCYDSTKTHRLLATTATTTCTGVTSAYAYDATGNTTTRPDGTASQTLSWSAEGKLDTLKEGTSTTGYVYDADGSLLIRRNAAGETVLYLGATEVHLDTSTSTAKFWAQRYYTGAGSTIALRTNKSGTDKLAWLAADHHGTSSLAVDNATKGITKRYSTPFGADRGQPTFGPWPDDKGFLGASADSGTGLTHLGAREYEPSTGRFISVDPLLNVAEHQSLNGYTYGNNNPATLSDPAGLDPCGGLKCGHEGDDCSDASIYCYGSKSDGTADTTGVVPSGGGGTASASSTGDTVSDGKGRETPHCGYNISSCGVTPYQGNFGDSTNVPVIPEEAQKEVRIAACGWVPVLGAGCDAYDLKRAVDDGNGWGIAAAVVGFLPFGDSVKVPNALRRIKDAVKLSRPAKLTQDMAKWKNRSLVIGGEKILVDSSGMKHILSRHHPKYWDGSVKKQQTFFGKEMSIDGVGDAITQIIRDKRDDVISNGGASGSYQIRGEYNGERYVVGLNNGRVAQFYPAY